MVEIGGRYRAIRGAVLSEYLYENGRDQEHILGKIGGTPLAILVAQKINGISTLLVLVEPHITPFVTYLISPDPGCQGHISPELGCVRCAQDCLAPGHHST